MRSDLINDEEKAKIKPVNDIVYIQVKIEVVYRNIMVNIDSNTSLIYQTAEPNTRNKIKTMVPTIPITNINFIRAT